MLYTSYDAFRNRSGLAVCWCSLRLGQSVWGNGIKPLIRKNVGSSDYHPPSLYHSISVYIPLIYWCLVYILMFYITHRYIYICVGNILYIDDNHLFMSDCISIWVWLKTSIYIPIDCKEFLWLPHRLKPCRNSMLLLGFVEHCLGQMKQMWQDRW